MQANVKPGALPETVVNALAPSVEAMRERLPRPTASPWAARWRRAQKSQASVIAVVPVMLLIMLTVLMIELQSFQRLVLVLTWLRSG